MKKQIYQEGNIKQSKKIKDKITSGLEFPVLFPSLCTWVIASSSKDSAPTSVSLTGQSYVAISELYPVFQTL